MKPGLQYLSHPDAIASSIFFCWPFVYIRRLQLFEKEPTPTVRPALPCFVSTFFKIHRVFDKIKEEEKKATYFTVGWCSSAAGDTAKKRARVCEAKKSVTCRPPVDAVLPRRASASSESRSAISLEGITQSSSLSLLTSRHERQEEY